MRDYFLRCETKAAWDAFAASEGWTVEITPPDAGGWVKAGEGTVVPAPGVNIDEIGPVVTIPGVYDPETGEEITPPVIDNWHHVNLRLLDDAPPSGRHLFRTDVGGKVVMHGEDRAVEVGEPPNRIQVIDPADIETPIRIWAGGMYMAELPEAAN